MKKVYSDISIILGDTEKGVEKIKSLISEYNISDFDIKTIYTEEEKIEKILEEIDYLPIFSKKRLLHIKNSEKLTKTDCETLEFYFLHPPAHICIVFTGMDIKPPLKSYAENILPQETKGLFPQVFRMRRKEEKKKFVAILMEHLRLNEREFTPIIAAAEIYLKNVLLSQKTVDIEILNKFQILYQLDFNLKTGRCHIGSELEIFLHYLFR